MTQRERRLMKFLWKLFLLWGALTACFLFAFGLYVSIDWIWKVLS